VHAGTRARFEEAYRDIADRLELPGRDNPKIDVLRLVSNWLCDETNGKWTLVLDNVDDIEVFYPKRSLANESPAAAAPLAVYLPQSRNGSILIISRSKDAAARLAGGHKKILEVQTMDADQSLQLLRNKLEEMPDQEGAAELVRALDFLPLAITQAAAYINRGARMTVSGYLAEFHRNDRRRESLLNWDSGDLRRDESASNSLVTTWQMSFERIRQERRSAADLLSLMSFFNPQGIPESILRKHSVATPSEDETGTFNEDLNTLQAYSLISVTAMADTCEMHALVQFCTQVWLSSFDNLEEWKKKFVGLMAQEFHTGQFENWAKCQQLLPHIELLYDNKPDTDTLLHKWAYLLMHAAWYIQSALGKYGEAERVSRRALEVCETRIGKECRTTMHMVDNLAHVLRDQGKYSEAEKLIRQVLVWEEKELGVQHLDTLTSVNNLALVLEDLGKYSEAEELNRRALEGSEKELGVQHPDTLTSVNNLAGVLRSQGKYSEAEELHRRALEWKKKELGVQHPSTLTGMSNLAAVLRDQGKYLEAEKLNRRALEGSEKELGVQHPNTLASIYCLAYLLHECKRYEEASELYQRACDGYKQALGSQHPSTIACLDHFSAMRQEAEQETLSART
jgi:tetratricopeptide (TPR) repeat protein